MTIPIYTGNSARDFIAGLASPAVSLTDDNPVATTVATIIRRIANDGDVALAAICSELKDSSPQQWAVDSDYIVDLANQVSPYVRNVMERSAERVRRFGEGVKVACATEVNVADEAVHTGLRWQPVNRVGCYVPGGRYPLPSTALMTAVTASVAGVKDIMILSPKVGPEVALAAQLAGAQTVAQVGGAHGVAALALGTDTFPKVDMVVGPGNAYVTEAKRQLQGVIGIDMLAGPSEVAIIADGSANPEWVAVDLLAQAEHDPDARAYLLTDDNNLAQAVAETLPKLAETLELPGFVMEALSNSGLVVLDDLAACAQAANTLAPEHLELLVADPNQLRDQLSDYGALFVGHGTPVPMGDYMAGPNHTLPTARSARFSGGLTPMTFLRPQTWLAVQPLGNNPAVKEIYDDAATFAGVEGLTAHQAAARVRLS